MIPEGLKVLLMGAAGLLESHGEQHYADELRKAIAENLHLFQE